MYQQLYLTSSGGKPYCFTKVSHSIGPLTCNMHVLLDSCIKVRYSNYKQKSVINKDQFKKLKAWGTKPRFLLGHGIYILMTLTEL